VRPAVFLDRDGTLNEEVSYLDDPDRLRLIPGAAEAIGLLNEAGIPAIVVSNQAGIGRGYFSAETVEAIHGRLAGLLAAQGGRLDGVY
jgi:D-glycero-D-manno-heptose 1,7-bisphosphate phosphatase